VGQFKDDFSPALLSISPLSFRSSLSLGGFLARSLAQVVVLARSFSLSKKVR